MATTNNSTSKTVSTDQVKELRDKTGISIMQCRKALEEAGGDMEKAIIILRKKSGELAAKRADKTFGAGTVASYVHVTGNVGTMVVLSCETDFVSGNDEFKALARDIAMHITAAKPKYARMDSITEEEKAKAKEVFENEVKDKPAAMKEKILEGKLSAYFAEQVLMNQPFIKNPDITIQGLIDAGVQKFGEKIEVTRFVRLGVGESN